MATKTRSDRISFEDYFYYPALRTRPAEIQAYLRLTDEAKEKIIPLFTLGAWPRQDSPTEPMVQLAKAVAKRPFILDVTREAYLSDSIRVFSNPDGDFKAWRQFVSNYDNAIPVVQMPAGAKRSQIIRQARQLSRGGLGYVAFRLIDLTSDLDKAISALSSLDDLEKALVFVDVGYVRDTMPASLAAAIGVINEVREEIPQAIVVLLATSFPASVTAFVNSSSEGKSGSIPLLERELHFEIGLEAAIYGDYASIHGRVYPSTGGRYTPRIDYPLVDAWTFERRPDTDSQGYVSAAKSLIRAFPQIEQEDYWGSRKIVEASQGEIEGMKTPSSWIAVRANIHMHRQLEFSLELAERGDEGEDGFSDE